MDKYGVVPRSSTVTGPAPVKREGAVDPSDNAVRDDRISNIRTALLNFHLLLRCQRLYEFDHPQRIVTLRLAYDSLRSAVGANKLELHVMRDGFASSALGEGYLPDSSGEMLALSSSLRQAGIRRLSFLPKVRQEEVDILAELIKVSLMTTGQASSGQPSSVQTSAKALDSDSTDTQDVRWITSFAARNVEGILVNTQVDRKVDTLLTSLIATLVAYGGHSSPQVDAGKTVPLPVFDDLLATLKLLALITLPLEPARELSPEAGTRAIHEAMEEASHDAVRLLLSAISQYSPEDGETPQFYVKRLAESLIFEYLLAEFAFGSLTPVEVRPTFDRLGDVLVAAGKFPDPTAPGSTAESSLAGSWAAGNYRETLVTRFWLELPPREKSLVLRGVDLWCVPVVALRQTLGNLADAGADAPRREARHVVLNYARRLELHDARARQAVADGLNQLLAIIESLWPNQLPEDLSKAAIAALQIEQEPQTASALAAFIESLSHIAVVRGDYAGFETMLLAVEKTSGDSDLANSAVAKRLFALDRVYLLVDAGLAHRALDPVLPRLLVRDPDKLLDRLTVLLGETRGPSLLPAMARLIRTIGVPVLTILETRLYEARPQRVSAAIKLLATADPDRLLRSLPRALPSWEWNMQDLAISELSRPTNAPNAQTAACVFSNVLANAHPLVVPMMIDQIGLSGESSSTPLLIEIASGEHTTLRDQFVRIKAIEALGRLKATEAIQLLHLLAERRSGITFAEPSGLRAAAQDALALLEERPTSTSVRAAFDAPNTQGVLYAVPRRYTRVPLDAPLRAQVGAKSTGASVARVKTISLGGAYLESSKTLSVGQSVQLEVRSGLGKKIHCTAIVRNSTAGGNGVEFVHMNDEDRNKLRKLVLRKMPG